MAESTCSVEEEGEEGEWVLVWVARKEHLVVDKEGAGNANLFSDPLGVRPHGVEIDVSMRKTSCFS